MQNNLMISYWSWISHPTITEKYVRIPGFKGLIFVNYSLWNMLPVHTSMLVNLNYVFTTLTTDVEIIFTIIN